MTMQMDVSDVIEARRKHNRSLAREKASQRVVAFPIALLVILAALPALQFFGGYNYLLHLVLYAMMYAAMASSWNILGGYTGYISLGHNVFFCIGGYFSGMVLAYSGVTSLITAPVAGLVAAAVGFLVGLITLRMRGPTFIISSIALLMVVRILFDNWHFVGGANGVTLPQLAIDVQWTKLPYYYAMLVVVSLTVYASYRIKHSKFGLGLRAISQDEVKAESAGINTRLYKVSAFALSAFFVGMAGAIWGEYITYLRPNIFLIVLIAANMVLMCILGGKGTVAGPVVGAVLLIAFNEFFVTYFGASELNILGTGVIMVIALMFFPAGIVGTLAKAGKLPRFLNWD
ncbi:branched-chain amino acid ABC transporter permease [Polymorphum gilvum]|uniref:Amino acid ABC transporter permease protein n=1 Tax=Polymorphum gilvum (strain LMG 25793 / CGMCC 1.9160 / SL003B-26A1) TaxID=991905 RepID=F2IYM2_POLGS|nr:branched-chain amino acid ABC transporter permease [Polymorphum gilvum]ADZ69469.1 Amino acid ABC transporter permease protein [Polymorphum gilvum SL003B-26A1]